MPKTYWMSFCDPDKPKGEQFLGVSVVEVSDEEAAAIADEVTLRFPNAQPGAEWIAAASRKAYQLGCNPGGEVAFTEIPPEVLEEIDHPKHRLMQKVELEELGLI